MNELHLRLRAHAVSLSTLDRHALPLFTSLLNVVCAYDPVGYGIPYNHLLFSDYREQLVEQAVQILIVTLEHDGGLSHRPPSPSSIEEHEVGNRILKNCLLVQLFKSFSFSLQVRRTCL